MQRFFKYPINDEEFIIISGEDRDHIVRSLRMKKGENLVVCDGNFNDYFCEIYSIEKDDVVLKILKKEKNKAEPTVKIELYQAIPKSSKLDFIIQKSVELGVLKITPVKTRRCVATIEEKNAEKKILRFQKIAKQAACQSGRGVIPKINSVLNFEKAIEKIKENELKILFYEYGEVKLNSISLENKKNIGIFIGCEGGFEKDEVEYAKKNGVIVAGLGKRILRCETAPICVLSVFMHITGNL